MKKVVTVIGARPQFIKASPVSRAFINSGKINEILVHTGQHYDAGMSDVFFEELEIPVPQYNLNVGSGSHAVQTSEIMKLLEKVLMDEKPDMLLIYGDTNSTIAGALTAAKLHIPVAHVEAGLRSFNQRMPEEINRIVADRLSTLLFAPTHTAVQNLSNEGITDGVYKTGDVMYDVALQFTEKAQNRSKILSELGLEQREYVLSTVHRAENTDNKLRLENILKSLNEISNEMEVILPIHPRTKKMVDEFKLNSLLVNINLINPVGFLDMINLENNAKIIITDSGGVQKEAYFHKVPCLTLRDETEWVETIASGWNTLGDMTNYHNIVSSIKSILKSDIERKPINEYGNGDTSSKIVEILYEISL